MKIHLDNSFRLDSNLYYPFEILSHLGWDLIIKVINRQTNM